MTDLTPHIVANDLRARLAQLDDATRQVRGVNRRKAEALADYRQAQARARLRSDARTADLRGAEVDIECEQAMRDCRIAEADADAVITEAANLRTAVMGYQSLLRQAQAEVGLDGVRGVA